MSDNSINKLITKSYKYLKKLFGNVVKVPAEFDVEVDNAKKPEENVAGQEENVTVTTTATGLAPSYITANGELLAEISELDMDNLTVSSSAPDLINISTVTSDTLSKTPVPQKVVEKKSVPVEEKKEQIVPVVPVEEKKEQVVSPVASEEKKETVVPPVASEEKKEPVVPAEEKKEPVVPVAPIVPVEEKKEPVVSPVASENKEIPPPLPEPTSGGKGKHHKKHKHH
jgi:hypothetical protein